MELGIYFFVGAAIYLLPSWLGSEKQNRTAIFLLNIFLGWTFIGWVVALVWATTKEPPATATLAPPVAPVSPATALPPSLPADPDARAARLKDLRDRGIITQDEFMRLIDG